MNFIITVNIKRKGSTIKNSILLRCALLSLVFETVASNIFSLNCFFLPFFVNFYLSIFFPDVHYHINSMAPYSDYGFLFHKIGGFREDWCNDYYTSHYAKDAATILPVILLPKSCESVFGYNPLILLSSLT